MRALDKSRPRGRPSTLLIENPGNAGVISFKGEFPGWPKAKHFFWRRGYESIFPHRSRIYSTAVISPDDDKVELLDAAGQVFLRIGGGKPLLQPVLGRCIRGLPEWSHISYRIRYFYSRWSGGVFPRPRPP